MPYQTDNSGTTVDDFESMASSAAMQRFIQRLGQEGNEEEFPTKTGI